jgi:hypothetical protein
MVGNEEKGKENIRRFVGIVKNNKKTVDMCGGRVNKQKVDDDTSGRVMETVGRGQEHERTARYRKIGEGGWS